MTRPVPAANVRLKRACHPPARDDGTRILVDRLWPRGVRKADLALDRWIKDLSPSTELRSWFDHDPRRWDEFRGRCRAEPRGHGETLSQLRGRARDRAITLIYPARDEVHNHAVVLRSVLLGRSRP